MTMLGDDPRMLELVSGVQRTVREVASKTPGFEEPSVVGLATVDRAAEACAVTMVLAAAMNRRPLKQEHVDIFAENAAIADNLFASLGVVKPYFPPRAEAN